MGLVTLAAFAFLLRPYRAIAEPDTQIGGGTDLTRTLKLDNKSAEWDAIVEKLSIQRQRQEEERIAVETARKKADAEAIAAKDKAVAPVQQKVIVPTVIPKVISGNKVDWMTAAGIPQILWPYVDSIVTRESGWNPNAVNPNGGACGLGQQLPCGKWAGVWNDPVAALKAMTTYVNTRYGGWAQAVTFWNANHWY